MRMIRKSDQASVVDQLLKAESYFSRLRGLIGKKEFRTGEGLLFPRCNSIHMWMMSISIDVLFLQKQPESTWIITSSYQGLKPWKLFPVMDGSADDVLELPEGTVSRLGLKNGEVLCIVS